MEENTMDSNEGVMIEEDYWRSEEYIADYLAGHEKSLELLIGEYLKPIYSREMLFL